MTTRDGWIGGGVMIGATFILSAIGIWARRSGYDAAGEVLKSLAFPLSMTAAMPFTFFKGQPWKAQALIIAVMFILLVGASILATQI
jgi:hypothetical protein